VITIAIALAEPDATYDRGDVVKGELTLRAEAPATCEILLEFQWHAHGKGDSGSGTLDRGKVFTGALAAGEERTLPFEVPVPADAEPYRGEIFEVAHRLRAVAAIEGEPPHRHSEATAPVNVTPAPRSKAHRVAPLRRSQGGRIRFLVQSLAVFVLGVGTVAVGAVTDIGLLAALGGTVASVAFFLVLLGFKGALAERKTGSVGLTLEQEGAEGYRDAPGSTPLRCTVTTRAREAAVRVQLRVQESTVRSFGGNRRNITHPLHDETIALPEVSPGTFRASFPVPTPSEVPGPFRRGSDKVEWELFVTVEVPGTPQWLQLYPLDVQPGEGSR